MYGFLNRAVADCFDNNDVHSRGKSGKLKIPVAVSRDHGLKSTGEECQLDWHSLDRAAINREQHTPGNVAAFGSEKPSLSFGARRAKESQSE